MNNFYHKKTWNSGMTQMHLLPLLIPLIQVITNISQTRILLNYNCVGIRSHLCRTSMSLRWLCLTMAGRKSSCCSFKTPIQILQHQGRWQRAQKFHIFVLYPAEKHYVSLTCCLMTWKLRTL